MPVPPSLFGTLGDTAILDIKDNNLDRARDRAQDRGFSTEHELPNLGYLVVDISNVETSEAISLLNELNVANKVEPNLEVPYYGAGFGNTLIGSGGFNLNKRPFGVKQLGIGDTYSVSEGAERTSLPEILETVSVPQAHQTTRGENAVLAVIDTGISGEIIPPERQLAGIAPQGGDPWSPAGGPGGGHGSMIAGIAAGDADTMGVDGVAPEAQVVSCKATRGPNGGLSSTSIIVASDFVLGIRSGETAQAFQDQLPETTTQQTGNIVVNNSWGLAACSQVTAGGFQTCDALLAEATVDIPNNQNVTTVFAAGNLAAACNRPFRNTLWCGIPGVVSVAAVDKELAVHDYSSRGPGICGRFAPTTAAPTYGVLPWGDGYADFGAKGGGTSAAAPIASGVIALMRSVHPAETPFSYIRAIEATSSNIPLGRASPYNVFTGFGLVNGQRALQAQRVTKFTAPLVPQKLREAIRVRRTPLGGII